MKTPEKYINCPECGKQIPVSLNTITEESTGKIQNRYWVYTCLDCKHGYTTTESDTLSMELE